MCQLQGRNLSAWRSEGGLEWGRQAQYQGYVVSSLALGHHIKSMSFFVSSLSQVPTLPVTLHELTPR
jgi:hypothetical protein